MSSPQAGQVLVNLAVPNALQSKPGGFESPLNSIAPMFWAYFTLAACQGFSAFASFANCETAIRAILIENFNTKLFYQSKGEH